MNDSSQNAGGAYTDTDVQTASAALAEAPLGCSEEQDVRLILDTVAPAIAARAIRALESEMRTEADEMGAYAATLWRATGKRLRKRADEIDSAS